ncbi:MAG: hypothetical protein JW932_14625, partial [Deltaproteobacteria bacterium]|nr:hypothetical protein [Deltaproteobacteria bacterium]
SIAGTASDNIAVSQVTWFNLVGGDGTATGTTSWSIAVVALLPGTNIITVHASDAAENIASAIITVDYIPKDVLAPVVSITSPTVGGSYQTSDESVILSGIASDNVDVIQVTWSNASGGNGLAKGTQNWATPEIRLLEGENIISIGAKDSAGNEGKQTFIVTYQPQNVDTTPPQIKITSPKRLANFFINTPTVDLSGTASDNVGVTKVTWENAKGGSGMATGTTTWSIYGLALSPGWNQITITATDAMGNIGQTFVNINYQTKKAPKAPKRIFIR